MLRVFNIFKTYIIVCAMPVIGLVIGSIAGAVVYYLFALFPLTGLLHRQVMFWVFTATGLLIGLLYVPGQIKILKIISENEKMKD